MAILETPVRPDQTFFCVSSTERKGKIREEQDFLLTTSVENARSVMSESGEKILLLVSLDQLRGVIASIEQMMQGKPARRDTEALDRYFDSAESLLGSSEKSIFWVVGYDASNRDLFTVVKAKGEDNALARAIFEKPDFTPTHAVSLDDLYSLEAGMEGARVGTVIARRPSDAINKYEANEDHLDALERLVAKRKAEKVARGPRFA